MAPSLSGRSSGLFSPVPKKQRNRITSLIQKWSFSGVAFPIRKIVSEASNCWFTMTGANLKSSEFILFRQHKKEEGNGHSCVPTMCQDWHRKMMPYVLAVQHPCARYILRK